MYFPRKWKSALEARDTKPFEFSEPGKPSFDRICHPYDAPRHHSHRAPVRSLDISFDKSTSWTLGSARGEVGTRDASTRGKMRGTKGGGELMAPAALNTRIAGRRRTRIAGRRRTRIAGRHGAGVARRRARVARGAGSVGRRTDELLRYGHTTDREPREHDQRNERRR